MNRAALCVRVLILLVFLSMLGCAGELPGNLGARQGVLAACPSSPNCVSSQARDDRHSILPFPVTGDPSEAFARLRGILVQRGDTIVIKEQPGYIRVEFRTRFFVDDGEFLMDGAQKIIHVRSASRLGYWDLGKNRSRLEEIRRVFAAKGE